MCSLPIQATTVTLASSELEIPAYLAAPTAPGPFPGVVVIQEVFGVNAHIQSVCQRLAAAGYIAIAPHLYHRQVANFEVGYSPAELALGRQYKAATRSDQLLRDIQAAIAYLDHSPTIRAGGVGCLGFCFGGHVAYLAATLPAIKATACFYGAGIPTMTPGGGEPTLSLTAHIQGRVYGFFGEADPLIPQQEVDQIESALTQHGIPHRILRYPGADHGFFCDQRSSYQALAAEDAWQQVLELFATTLNT
ncbi:MAG: dienelactone hydrolase family protein [Cyanobacteria bacterium REEB459]|nr:dienelactone hydrolase family protein [Cyanobacteria bacterium REEB459]